MPEYVCENCGYKALSKSRMNRHLNRMYPCNSVLIVSNEEEPQKLEIKGLNVKVVKKTDLNREMEKELNNEIVEEK